MKQSKALAEFVRRIRSEKNLSTGDVSRRSLGAITDAYVSRIENGYVKNVSIEKLKALAKGLGVTENSVMRIALGQSEERPTDLIEMMAETYGGQNLNENDWREIEAVVRTMIEQKKNRVVNNVMDLIDGFTANLTTDEK